MRRATILAVTLLASVVVAQKRLSYGKPADVGMSGEQLAAAAQLFDKAVAADELRGVVLLVSRHGKIVLHEAYGWRDLEKKKPMRKDSLFRMASNSKAVTAAGVLLLAEDEKLRLDDPVRRHLPSFDTARGGEITIEQLLTHTSGMRIGPIFLRPLLQKSKANPDAPSLQAEVRRFGEVGAAQPPGTSWSYSNAGYNTLAGLIDRVSGRSYKAFLAARIYKPLGMKDSCNHESDADPERMSAIFRRGADGKWRVGWQPGDAPDYPFCRGSGGMVSTALDYAVFCQMFLNGGTYGDKRILSEKSVAAAIRSQTTKVKGASYGHGWQIDRKGGGFAHGGSDGTWSWCDPQRKLIGLVFTQSPSGGKNPRSKFQEMVTAACVRAR